MARLALTDTPPQYCVVCQASGPEKQYVDFDAAAERGWTPEGLSLDWIVMCESCVKDAALLIGMEPRDEREVQNLRVQVDRLQREVRQAQGYADRLEDAFEHRAQPIEIDHRRKPRQIKEPA